MPTKSWPIIGPEMVAAVMNDMLRLDPKATLDLLSTRVVCTRELADHDSIQVGVEGQGKEEVYRVGTLGVLNGLFGADSFGYGPIVAVFNAKDELTRFEVRRFDTEPRPAHPASPRRARERR